MITYILLAGLARTFSSGYHLLFVMIVGWAEDPGDPGGGRRRSILEPLTWHLLWNFNCYTYALPWLLTEGGVLALLLSWVLASFFFFVLLAYITLAVLLAGWPDCICYIPLTCL